MGQTKKPESNNESKTPGQRGARRAVTVMAIAVLFGVVGMGLSDVGWVLAYAVAMLALARVVTIGWKWLRATRLAADTDPLTGAGNRSMLESRTAALLTDRRFVHHVLVTIDMDCFKATNDTIGYAAGDRLLTRVADGLRQVAESSNASETVIVRLGGDEFLLSLHDSRPIHVGLVRGELDQLRQQEMVVDETFTVTASFNYGIATGIGSLALDHLMAASDLDISKQESKRHADYETFNMATGA